MTPWPPDAQLIFTLSHISLLPRAQGCGAVPAEVGALGLLEQVSLFPWIQRVQEHSLAFLGLPGFMPRLTQLSY